MSINEKMTALADAVRSKTGKEGALSLDGMIREIIEIQTGTAGRMFTARAAGQIPEVSKATGSSIFEINFTSNAKGV